MQDLRRTRIAHRLPEIISGCKFVADGFETVTASCPVPIVMAGGKKLPEIDALNMAYRAIQEGAWGVDMGRNVFQAEAPAAMIQAVRSVVHDGEKPERAYELYQSIKSHTAHTRSSIAR